jgi:hypothetical protein
MSSNRRLILHIGMYKTGTTAVQTHLTSIRDDLLKKSILYPRTGLPARSDIRFGHHEIAVAAQQAVWQPSDPPKLLDELRQEINASDAHTIILSSEMFCSLMNPAVLKPYFDVDDMQIFVSLRRQDEFVNAMYYTAVMEEKRNLTTEDFWNGPITGQLDYHALLSRWVAAFPGAKFSVRIYEDGRSPRSNAIADFLTITGLSDEVSVPAQPLTLHNTLPARVTIALRELTEAGLAPADFFRIFTAAHRIYATVKEERSLYPPSQRRALIEQYRPSNRMVRRQFYDGQDQDLFADTLLGSDEDWAEQVGSEDRCLSRFLLDMANYITRRAS